MIDGERITELELELMAQRELLETLSGQLAAVSDESATLAKRIARVERQLEAALGLLDVPPNEKPPHS